MDVKKVLLPVFFCLLLLAAQAGSKRAAMVLETRGNNTLTVGQENARMRTLQVLPGGALIEVPADCVLRLSYFKSGRKEKIVGPCQVRVAETSSQKIGGTGRIITQDKRDASTELEKTENLRRMGGALQANALSTPEGMLAKLDSPPSPGHTGTTSAVVVPQATVGVTTNTKVTVTETQSTQVYKYRGPKPSVGPSAVRTDIGPRRAKPKGKPLKLRGVSGLYLAGQPLKFQWRGGLQAGSLSLTTGNEVAYQGKFQGRDGSLPKNALKPGKTYKIELRSGGRKIARSFQTLTAEQTKIYRAAATKLLQQERHDHRALYTQLILLQSDLGLLVEAEKTGIRALNEFFLDSGFMFALAQIEEKLGRRDAAKELLEKARDVEDVDYG